ncbi:conserved hypothetical protein [methanotrophic bacterial endosymbiont of Bathymodiolus sp.]|nr:conserved hypothetical protein [methanotrophic bacterial endosymbiont of Bathymodiolus sp.]
MTSLELLHQEILEGISQLTGVQHCGNYPRRMDEVTLPAVFVDLVELEPDTDPGTDELALITHWEVRVIVSESQKETDKIIRSLILSIMIWLFSHSWPQKNIGRAQIKQAAPDHFSPELQGHIIWLIEWTHSIRVGDSVWYGKGVVPKQVFIGSNNAYEEITIDGV